MEMYDTPRPLEAYLNTPLHCSCGWTHYAPIKHVSIRPGALNDLPGFVKGDGYAHPFIICDKITYEVAARRCTELLTAAGIQPSVHVIEHLAFDEATAGELVIALPPDTDVLIAVGTGSITDMVRLLSARLHLPGMTVATGAPMDGFAASIGIVNVNGLKCTLPAKNTEAIIGDTDILTSAPYRMTVAGFGDLIGKLSCLNDWEISAMVNGEHICPHIIELVRSCVDDVLSRVPEIKRRDGEALGKVMNGLVLSGVAISLYGDSRPASGAEHHMSHYWEAIGDQRGHDFAMHGEQVAVGTVMSLRLAQLILAENVDFDLARERAESFSYEAWESEIRRAYGRAAGEVIALEAKAGKNLPGNVLRRIDGIERCWDKVRARLAAQPDPAWLHALLKDIGCPASPADIGIDAALFHDTLLYSKEVRARYTIMQLMHDLGLAEKLADKLTAELYG